MKDKYTEVINVNKDTYKVLQLTDLHIEDKSRKDVLLFIDNIISATLPDLLILTGDNVIRNEELVLRQINDIVVKHSARMGVILGNHDGEYSKLPRKKYMDFVSELKNSVNKTNEIDGRFGNFVVDINFNKENKFSLVCLDSGGYLTIKERITKFATTPYAKITDSQIAWYNEATSSSKNVMLFSHIPMRAYAAAWYHALKTNSIDYGYARENLRANMKKKSYRPVCYPGVKEKVFEKLSENGRLRAVFAGHDHVNDFKVKYRDVYFVFGQKSGYTSYNNLSRGFEDNVGGTLITLKANETFSIEQIIMAKLKQVEHGKTN